MSDKKKQLSGMGIAVIFLCCCVFMVYEERPRYHIAYVENLDYSPAPIIEYHMELTILFNNLSSNAFYYQSQISEQQYDELNEHYALIKAIRQDGVLYWYSIRPLNRTEFYSIYWKYNRKDNVVI